MKVTTFYLRGLAGVTVPLQLSAPVTVAQLRNAVELKEGVPTQQQILTCGGHNIGSSGPFEHESESTIFLSVGLLGGGKKNQKGRRRNFITGEEEQAEKEKTEREGKWKVKKGLESDDDDEESEDEAPVKKASSKPKKPVVLDQYGIPLTDSEEESSDGEVDDLGNPIVRVHDLIEVANPNRNQKQHKKVTDWDEGDAAPLTRREKEEVKEQEAARRYQKLHQAGKTEESRADLDRLKLIREKRAADAERRGALLDAKK